MNLLKSNDGSFWISIDDLSQKFSSFSISKVDDNHYFTSTELSGNFSVYFFEIEEAGLHTFGITQLDKRFFTSDDEYEYSNARLILLTSNEEDPTEVKNISYLNSGVAKKRDCYVEFDLKP